MLRVVLETESPRGAHYDGTNENEIGNYLKFWWVQRKIDFCPTNQILRELIKKIPQMSIIIPCRQKLSLVGLIKWHFGLFSEQVYDSPDICSN